MLYDPAEHETIDAAPWEEARVRTAIAGLAADTAAERLPDGGWLPHSRDIEDDDAGPWSGVYLGSAGTVWALDALQRRGLADLPPASADGLVAGYRSSPDEGAWSRGLWLGESGVLLVEDLLGAPSTARHARLLELIRGNVEHPAREVMLGAPGTMLAAAVLHERTGEGRWADALRESADHLWDAWAYDDALGCHLWRQELYGHSARYVGPAHGLAGTVAVLARGAELLPVDRAAELERRAVAAAHALAIRQDGRANWPATADGTDPRRPLQWCHGAPGLIASLGGLALDDDAFGELLVAGGELVWEAGPLRKGAGLCHGTAGNGYAFLRLHARTGDPRWLARARAFAMHAIGQVEERRAAEGRGRHGLWTGDPGTALYLAACLDADPRLPAFDVW